MKKYDGLYIFAGNAKDDVLESNFAKAIAEIERFGGKIEAQDILGKRTFARPMHKRENGVYALVRFELDPSQVKDLVNRYRLVEEVFRVQILAEKPCADGAPASDRAKWGPLAETKEGKSIVAAAERLLSEPIPDTPDELYLEFSRNGNRRNYEQNVSHRVTNRWSRSQ